jgi:hypothetical protein
MRFILRRADIAQRSMPTLPIVKQLDVPEHVSLRFRQGLVDPFPDPLALELAEKTLRAGIVPTVAFTAHAAGNPVVVKQILIIIGGVLYAPIAVVHQPRGRTTLLDRHGEGITDQLGIDVLGTC